MQGWYFRPICTRPPPGRISRFRRLLSCSAAQQKEEFLLPDTSIREIMTAFERSEADVLAVIDRPEHRAAVGTVSEANVLRTYGEKLERRNQELFFR